MYKRQELVPQQASLSEHLSLLKEHLRFVGDVHLNTTIDHNKNRIRGIFYAKDFTTCLVLEAMEMCIRDSF